MVLSVTGVSTKTGCFTLQRSMHFWNFILTIQFMKDISTVYIKADGVEGKIQYVRNDRAIRSRNLVMLLFMGTLRCTICAFYCLAVSDALHHFYSPIRDLDFLYDVHASRWSHHVNLFGSNNFFSNFSIALFKKWNILYRYCRYYLNLQFLITFLITCYKIT